MGYGHASSDQCEGAILGTLGAAMTLKTKVTVRGPMTGAIARSDLTVRIYCQSAECLTLLLKFLSC